MVPVNVPPLADRGDDISLLVPYFIEQLNKIQGLPKREISPGALRDLQRQSWPGNVRQLRNTLERILILGAGNGEIQPDEIPESTLVNQNSEAVAIPPEIMSMPLRAARLAFETEYLKAQILRFRGNISQTAKFVGMERSALHRKLKTLGIAGQMDQN